jgi:hypothetical protein
LLYNYQMLVYANTNTLAYWGSRKVVVKQDLAEMNILAYWAWINKVLWKWPVGRLLYNYQMLDYANMNTLAYWASRKVVVKQY